MIAKEVMNSTAALLNDTALSVFTYSAQVPYLNMALIELQEECELNNVPITNEAAAVITVLSGVEGIGGGGTQKALPPNFIEPLDLQERVHDNQYSYVPMTRLDFVPENQVPTAYLIYWAWDGVSIKFIAGGATGDVDVKIHYMKSIFKEVVDENGQINMINAKSFLVYKSAAFCAQFIGENETRATELNGLASIALQRTLGISTKGRQSIFTRRRPFQAAWRSRRIIS